VPKTDFTGILGDAGKGRFKPVYFLHGDEAFLTRQAVETIVSHAVDQATADFNFDRFHGADLNAERLATVLHTPPMMAARRVILIKEFELSSPRDKQMLADYADKPIQSTLLILACGERIRIDQRKKSPKWAARLQDSAATAVFWPLREPELMRWIVDRAGLEGKKINSKAAYELYARIGGGLARLADEIAKLAIFCRDREEITGEDVRFMTGIEKGGTVFDWVDALSSGKTLKACYLAGYLTGHGESAVGAVWFAASHFMTLARIKELLAQRDPEREVINKLGLIQRPPEVVRNLFAQARTFTVSQIERTLELLLETDLKLKTSSLPDRLVLEDLAFRFGQEVA